MRPIYQPKSGAKAIPLAFASLRGVEVKLQIGIAPSEQGREQLIRFNVKVGFPDTMTEIADSANGLKDGFDYTQIRNAVMEACQEKALLLEPLANKVAKNLFRNGNALTCEIEIIKTRAWANVEETSILIYREA